MGCAAGWNPGKWTWPAHIMGRGLAFAQSSQQKMFGYKRAAAATLALDLPLTDLVGPDGAFTRRCRPYDQFEAWLNEVVAVYQA